MGHADEIQIFHRDSGSLITEKVLGEDWIRFLYKNWFGRCLAAGLLSRRSFSRFFGWFQNRSFSAAKIEKVAGELGIDLSEAEKPVEEYRCFNDFFSRALKKNARPIDHRPEQIISPCDARLLVYPSMDRKERISIKGCNLRLEDLLGDLDISSRFSGATLFVYRLCPADYHRFHFPEDCVPGFPVELNGPLHSVNPIALASGWKILDNNLRHCTLLKSESEPNPIAMVEIGAMCVGSVVQTFIPQLPVKRGEEKGIFRFGGSTVIVLYPADRVVVDDDIRVHSRRGVETLVKLG
ncbi:MAG: phosphatidylserine decarboxylase, partial [Planctomycetes bacterium]|nr:phosphatidylserine decarboxylase [Planctomycetota bacterium]